MLADTHLKYVRPRRDVSDVDPLAVNVVQVVVSASRAYSCKTDVYCGGVLMLQEMIHETTKVIVLK